MLVLSRRSQQSVLIGGRIKVTVLNITNSYVELGIEAPAHIAVDREEVHLRKLAAKTVVKVVRRTPSNADAASAQSSNSRSAESIAPAHPRRTRDR